MSDEYIVVTTKDGDFDAIETINKRAEAALKDHGNKDTIYSRIYQSDIATSDILTPRKMRYLADIPQDSLAKIMEINPRVPACVKTGIVAGVNWAQIILDGCLGKPQKEYVYKEGAVLRHLGFDVLWFLHSKNRFKVKPSWFKFFGGKVRYQDFDLFDPMPFIKGTWHNVKRLFDPSFRKAKSGVAKI